MASTAGIGAMIYDKGVCLVADTQVTTYMRQASSMKRFYRLNEYAAVASSGDLADFQWTLEPLQRRQEQDDYYQDGSCLDAPGLANLIRHHVYEKR